MVRPLRLASLRSVHWYPTKFIRHQTFLNLASQIFSSGDLRTYKERKLFPYSKEQVYDVVANVALYERFVPLCTGSRIVTPPVPMQLNGSSPSPVADTLEAELTVGFMHLDENYVSKVIRIPYESVEAVASSSTPLFKTLQTTWRFEPHSRSQSDGPRAPGEPVRWNSTWVSLDLAYAFTNPLHASISAAFFGQVSGLMVKAFEERCKEIYGPREN